MTKKKILIFDIDGTLCDISKPVNQELRQTLIEISTRHQIVLSSGKPFGYIAGFVRQLGLHDCVIVGENGATIMYSASFPPNDYYMLETSKEIAEYFDNIKLKFCSEFGNSIWFQPNMVNLTVFPIQISAITTIHQFAKQFECDKINIYYHKDSVDFTQIGFDKGSAVDILMKKLDYQYSDLYIFGDGSNDLPMLRKTENSFLITNTFECFTPKQFFASFDELNNYLKNTMFD